MISYGWILSYAQQFLCTIAQVYHHLVPFNSAHLFAPTTEDTIFSLEFKSEGLAADDL